METSTSYEFEDMNSTDRATYKLCDLEHHVITSVNHTPHLQNEGLRWNTSKTPQLWIRVYRTAWHTKLIFNTILLKEGIKTAATIKKETMSQPVWKVAQEYIFEIYNFVSSSLEPRNREGGYFLLRRRQFQVSEHWLGA